MDYLWFEEMGLINQPKETKEEQLKYFEEYLISVAARSKYVRKNLDLTLKKRGKAV